MQNNDIKIDESGVRELLAVFNWMDGADATVSSLENSPQAAQSLGEFLKALKAIGPAGGPLPGEHNFFRGVPLAERNEAVHNAVKGLASEVDANAALSAWKK